MKQGQVEITYEMACLWQEWGITGNKQERGCKATKRDGVDLEAGDVWMINGNDQRQEWATIYFAEQGKPIIHKV